MVAELEAVTGRRLPWELRRVLLGFCGTPGQELAVRVITSASELSDLLQKHESLAQPDCTPIAVESSGNYWCLVGELWRPRVFLAGP